MILLLTLLIVLHSRESEGIGGTVRGRTAEQSWVLDESADARPTARRFLIDARPLPAINAEGAPPNPVALHSVAARSPDLNTVRWAVA